MPRIKSGFLLPIGGKFGLSTFSKLWLKLEILGKVASKSFRWYKSEGRFLNKQKKKKNEERNTGKGIVTDCKHRSNMHASTFLYQTTELE